ncbi:putative succinyltransferase [Corynebacterium diphtheriae HC01]|uniref:DapH/DapD/GlmU-related protein n=1 Tax=Corynebacterium diphtheriae TaxID=1717 RepID=UPI000245B069|nr:DapH/DapD/GlmU-related protein [Corynebacterium diphtheriae]AEX43954.1 putative succinyltransferase [Corynebacterium diphtheriae 241]AEX74140.1 putative succinyltransferase [Corynebacterium diphtheriae HC01]PSA74080.1 succinyltransferase [Corynebacterium diphtheriae]CAB0499317.1 succinyltransferase [Corynebacterium diphtheriae]CAB0502430.1 succinyltransferase [Corynebacterium diphtheriae]
MSQFGATAIGIANIAMNGEVLDTWYPTPELVPTSTSPSYSERLGAQDLPPKLLSLVRLDEDRLVEQVAVRTHIGDLDTPPIDAHDVFLRLHLLSHRLVRPLEINMDNAMSILSRVVWTNKGPCLPENFENIRMSLRNRGLIHVYGIDRLPRMVDYVVPTGVEITEAERVRLGAYLAEGTKVLREGYVSFNAGTLGAGRIEGRLYSGTVVGDNVDLGISASIVPDKPHAQLRVGANCVFGLGSAVMGINLGDNVRVGNNVVIDKETMVYFADRDVTAAAAILDGQSDWQIHAESGRPEPVVRPA